MKRMLQTLVFVLIAGLFAVPVIVQNTGRSVPKMVPVLPMQQTGFPVIGLYFTAGLDLETNGLEDLKFFHDYNQPRRPM